MPWEDLRLLIRYFRCEIGDVAERLWEQGERQRRRHARRGENETINKTG
jgi:hypothetical protein